MCEVTNSYVMTCTCERGRGRDRDSDKERETGECNMSRSASHVDINPIYLDARLQNTDVGCRGREPPKKNKNNCVSIKKRQKPKNLMGFGA